MPSSNSSLSIFTTKFFILLHIARPLRYYLLQSLHLQPPHPHLLILFSLLSDCNLPTSIFHNVTCIFFTITTSLHHTRIPVAPSPSHTCHTLPPNHMYPPPLNFIVTPGTYHPVSPSHTLSIRFPHYLSFLISYYSSLLPHLYLTRIHKRI